MASFKGKLATMYSFIFLLFKAKDINLWTKGNVLISMLSRVNEDLKLKML
ncbi:hypothetical protein SAMN02799624_05883 [Paenibacillus sp. UNC496MF]|nr:hypothetical protein SAMN02799624_05883 [Paenibacillus sp. UNC496MF]